LNRVCDCSVNSAEPKQAFRYRQAYGLAICWDCYKAMWRFFVYEIVVDGRVVYVGKGQQERANASARRFGGKPVIVAYFKEEWDALAFERKRIAERMAEGCALKNVLHGNHIPWEKRTDTQQMAREVLQWVAGRVGRWQKAGKIDQLSKIVRVPREELISLHQRFGA